MADRGRPFFPGAAIYAALSEAVQPPDDRTYSAEVTVFRRNLLHHRSAHSIFLHALNYDTTKFPICQGKFQRKAQTFQIFFVQSASFQSEHHRSAHSIFLHALNYDTTKFPICQGKFQRKAQTFQIFFVQSASFQSERHRSAHSIFLHALNYDTTKFPICQGKFQRKAQTFQIFFVQSASFQSERKKAAPLRFCGGAAKRYFIYFSSQSFTWL